MRHVLIRDEKESLLGTRKRVKPLARIGQRAARVPTAPSTSYHQPITCVDSEKEAVARVGVRGEGCVGSTLVYN